MLRIIVDFNNMTVDGDKVLVARDIERDKEIYDQLSPGMRVIIYEPNDIAVEAVIEPIEVQDGRVWWYGAAEWSTLVDL
ncbi:hypothetical protein G4Y79_04780 [Phototrophicus methaneseepsis]|uniref:Uncharacterized protein n=1 Tax=Phototrophicus methaneseepsis TaxID=2710758 RepID=A0A7S8IFK7_9CHLR|nr:hypothetical protein [Phototrophicus methaneseepsis]QPC83701.1 hypothetical protein G4Y79_04780 [Phototrophicus methaneseepsis]